ncbi:MAG: hypothetical protein COT24_00290 [Candidatus Kerfeldbacteria bacterium CG08_land_8_20_14_0_20_40_16]|uniref:YdbS-like PH domain-containing protein n=1 Tax=Candidatus Kerfeldbacteria bacterium CG08_land_8_20_14_0_20_40_16 TaxID=2014244 RepID=A0A2H0YX15_9BACT|nr:MAG: hypothetical protein COT24_00290 [Candidatus Kerfeldbacteria bacterium CG08_land_8_20_14_0_20_40_16]
MSNNYFTKHLKEREEVIKIIRSYLLSHLWSILVSLFFIILPFFLLFPLFQRGFWGVLLFFLLLLFGLGAGARFLFIWYFNAFVITSQRIIDFDQRGLFEKTVSESIYEKIQDVSFKKKGIFSTVLNYGTIIIQTAGTNANLEIRNIFEPEKIQELITEIQKKGLNKDAEELSARELIDILEKAKEKMGEEKFNTFIKKKDIPEESKDDSPPAKNK